MLNGLSDAKIDQAPVLAITGMTYHDFGVGKCRAMDGGATWLADRNSQFRLHRITFRYPVGVEIF